MLNGLTELVASYAGWLTILKFLGLFTAAGSSIWGTVNVLTTTTRDGRKKLTMPGRIAIVLTISGLLISIVSEDLQRRRTANDQVERLAAEAKRTNEIIIAGQPLTSVSLQFEFSTASTSLWNTMSKAQEDVKENAESSQGGVPRLPFDYVAYEVQLMPLLSYVARQKSKDEPTAAAFPKKKAKTSEVDNSAFVLMPLDESTNTVLSFGKIAAGVSWLSDTDKRISAGFAPGEDHSRKGNSTPQVQTKLAERPVDGLSIYQINWRLDPVTLFNSIDRQIESVQPTARLPKILKVAIFCDMRVLPFDKNDFSRSYATMLWTDSDWGRKKINFSDELKNPVLSIEVNGTQDIRYEYVLTEMYDIKIDSDDHDFQTLCTLLKFERQ